MRPEVLYISRDDAQYSTPGTKKGKNNMDSTIKLINKYDRTLVDVIQWLDSNGPSNTEIRSKVDVMLNFERKLKEESEMELTKITYVGD